jgi:hypothetical protein
MNESGIPSIVAQIGAGLGGVKVLALTQGQAGRLTNHTHSLTHTHFDITERPHLRATWDVNK